MLRSQPPSGDRGGHGVVGTVISPDLILSAYSLICAWMSSMKPPEVARPTPSVFRSLMMSDPPLILPSTKSLMYASTALSTRLSTEVMITGCSVGSPTVWYWSESTPIARLPEAFAAWKTPMPEPPAAAYTMSAPASYMPGATILPFAGSLNPEKSPAGEMYSTSTVIPGLAALAPATYPASKAWISGVSTPPT